MNLKRQMLPLDSIKHAQINAILEHYGEDKQRIKACEELAELQVELFHYDSDYVIEGIKRLTCTGSSNSTLLRDDSYDKITSEIADVYVMLEQIVKIYDISNKDIEKAITLKLRRTEDIIRAEG